MKRHWDAAAVVGAIPVPGVEQKALEPDQSTRSHTRLAYGPARRADTRLSNCTWRCSLEMAKRKYPLFAPTG